MYLTDKNHKTATLYMHIKYICIYLKIIINKKYLISIKLEKDNFVMLFYF
jgi:hypothetical protein